MLCRLKELREASGADVVSEKPSDDGHTPVKQEVDSEWQEFVEEMQDLYKELLEDEGATAQACDEVGQRVRNMEEIVQLEREALLPTKLSQLASRFESQELVCQRMIRRAKEMLTTLKADEGEADLDEDEQASLALRPVRLSIAKVRALQFKKLVQAFFTARSHNRQEMITRAARQLRFAYPDALEEEITDIMEFPELAFVAISRRLEKGSEVTLDGILGEMEGRKANAQKLEQGAKELKLMFLQFEELIDTQGENLTAIEANIKTALEETTEAIGLLTETEQAKRAYQRKKLKFYIFLGFVGLYFVAYLYEQYFGDTGAGKHPYWYFFGSCFSAVGHFVAGEAEKGYELAAGQAQQVQSKTSVLQVLHRPHRRMGRHQQLAPESSEGHKKHSPSRGFIAPREHLLADPVIRSVALSARGGAARHRHSGLRKARAER